MSLSEELRESVGPLWEKTVSHPFVMELGDGTLPAEKWRVYFQQDHLFLKHWIALMSAGVVKAPDFAHARPLAAFIHGALQGEEGLFQTYFREEGLSQEEVKGLKHLPTASGQGSFLRRQATEGSFAEIITVLLGIEWPYLEWAQRLAAAGKRPENKYYQTWIDIHVSKEMEDFVTWMRGVVDNSQIFHTERLKELFLATIRYEYMFWEMAYRGERWPE